MINRTVIEQFHSTVDPAGAIRLLLAPASAKSTTSTSISAASALEAARCVVDAARDLGGDERREGACLVPMDGTGPSGMPGANGAVTFDLSHKFLWQK